MVNRTNEVYQAMGDGKKKIEENEQETSVIQRRGLRFTKNLKAGHILKKEDLFPLRPRNPDGIPPYQISDLLGKKLKKNVKADDYIRWEDIK